MLIKRIRALGLSAILVAWSLLSPRLPSRWHPGTHAAFGTALAALTRTPVGLRRWSGVRLGLLSAASVVVGAVVSTALPRVREEMVKRNLPDGTLHWLLLGIPFGTVVSEEAAYRGALGTVAADAFGLAGGRLVQATTFGLSHIADAQRTGEPVIPTVLVTGLAGWVFGWLYERSGSLLAPVLAHLAINESGAIAAVLLQRADPNSA
ncbi:putative metal-dependent membrane protease [Mycolicibacterium rhodesiae NBB3]|uniref:Putative metal-dependent membrane protease n=1 Tax=Mycolicibacterium rhodesiae (strain NBB3) TaxID=710685 RepID=G8RWH8_MYCRN|nr:putative metal-dependent membrane protease [Mycolicibacterium rhodesiae NBB3]